MFLKILFVFTGGGIGSMLRYLASLFAKKYFALPLLATFIVNITGCFLIGLICGFLLNKTCVFSDTIKLIIVIGFLGGLTTFSSLNIEVFDLIKTGKIFYGLSYMFLSCAFGLLATFLGYLIFDKLIK